MKKIESIDIWQNGSIKTATHLYVQGTSVNLGESAAFYWQLRNDEGQQISQGNLGISGEEYKAWGADDDYIYQIVASDLNLTLISE